MNLGTLMARLENEADAVLALDALADLPLFVEVADMGERHDETPGEYVANASRRFATGAGDEDWLGLMTAMERADDPARAALERMLRWALDRDRVAPTQALAATGGCSCGGGSGGCHGGP
jgi:hypothetical protein